jgi:hypothetical protein
VALTKVSPSLFQVSNNITSVTVGGSANTISLTFDSNGVITGASNNALSVANTAITGLIQAAQIGSANATLVTSGTLPAAALPAGSVLQVVSASFAQSFTTSSTSFVATHLTASITPRSASNKILIFSFARVDTQAANRDIRLTIYRNATNLGVGSVNMLTNINGISSRLQLSQVLHIQDSPATTSSTAYTVYINSPGAALVQLGDTDTDQVITLMEIAG